MKLAIIAALALSGCASLFDDSDYARLEQPEVAYECAAYLMGVDAPGPVPRVVWVDGVWQDDYGRWLNGEYFPDINTAYVRRFYRAPQTMAHEMTHALQVQRGEVPNEFEAKKAEQWIGDCINFGGM